VRMTLTRSMGAIGLVKLGVERKTAVRRGRSVESIGVKLGSYLDRGCQLELGG
jgi:hypothetical protein